MRPPSSGRRRRRRSRPARRPRRLLHPPSSGDSAHATQAARSACARFDSGASRPGAQTSGAMGSAQTKLITQPVGEVTTQARIAAVNSSSPASAARSPSPSPRRRRWRRAAQASPAITNDVGQHVCRPVRRRGCEPPRQARARRPVERRDRYRVRPPFELGALAVLVRDRKSAFVEQHLVAAALAVERSPGQHDRRVFAGQRRTRDHHAGDGGDAAKPDRRRRPAPAAQRDDDGQQSQQRRLERRGQRERRARADSTLAPQPRPEHQRQQQQIDLPALEVEVEREEERARQDDRQGVLAAAAGATRDEAGGQQPARDSRAREGDLREAIRDERQQAKQLGRERRVEEAAVLVRARRRPTAAAPRRSRRSSHTDRDRTSASCPPPSRRRDPAAATRSKRPPPPFPRPRRPARPRHTCTSATSRRQSMTYGGSATSRSRAKRESAAT